MPVGLTAATVKAEESGDNKYDCIGSIYMTFFTIDDSVYILKSGEMQISAVWTRQKKSCRLQVKVQ